MKAFIAKCKKVKIVSLFALILVIMMLLPVFTACKKAPIVINSDTTVIGTETADPTAETLQQDDLPELNYQNQDITFLAWNQSTTEYYADENSADNVENAVYSRNVKVENRLNVNLNFIEMDGNSSSFNDFCASAVISIESGTADYDAIACYSRSAGVLTLKGVLGDLMDTEYLNFSQPWWPSSLLEHNTINDSLYFMSGDIATSLIYQLTFMIANNNLIDEMNMSDPQQLAIDGDWTLEAMNQMCTGVYSDLNSDGTKSIEDKYGLVISSHTLMDLFFIGSGITYISSDTDGSLMLSDNYFTDKTYSLIEDLNTLLWSSNDGIYNKSFNTAIMASGTSLFYVLLGSSLASADFRNSEFDYSILPSPKYDSTQEDYYTTVGFPHSMYCIPVDAIDKDMSSAVMECMASESYRTVTPVLFDTEFKYKYSNSENDAKMFEIIRSTVVFDIGRIFFDTLGGDASSPTRVLRLQLENNTNTLASSSAKYKLVWNKALEGIMTSIQGLS